MLGATLMVDIAVNVYNIANLLPGLVWLWIYHM